MDMREKPQAHWLPKIPNVDLLPVGFASLAFLSQDYEVELAGEAVDHGSVITTLPGSLSL
ncbi:hypothetical protein PABG_11294 [Paracoccidioides brasiliensis Pb03]|nr:hypothetical protein PABG_11294 [Paracoccidioides brasiliensis Pb03]ODH50501.1 hypothetical protein GX48_03319 [Paracoccidioides brasiliensis]